MSIITAVHVTIEGVEDVRCRIFVYLWSPSCAMFAICVVRGFHACHCFEGCNVQNRCPVHCAEFYLI